MTSTNEHIFHFRAGKTEDAALLADLGWRTFDEAFAEYNKPEDMEAFKPIMYSPELQAAELADPNTEFVIVEAKGEAVAYIKINTAAAPEEIVAKKPLQISRLYITRAWLGQGLGDKLMQWCLSKAKADGFDVVWLTVWEHNERAKRFYRKYNFREMGELGFILGNDIQRDLYMQVEV